MEDFDKIAKKLIDIAENYIKINNLNNQIKIDIDANGFPIIKLSDGAMFIYDKQGNIQSIFPDRLHNQIYQISKCDVKNCNNASNKVCDVCSNPICFNHTNSIDYGKYCPDCSFILCNVKKWNYKSKYIGNICGGILIILIISCIVVKFLSKILFVISIILICLLVIFIVLITYYISRKHFIELLQYNLIMKASNGFVHNTYQSINSKWRQSCLCIDIEDIENQKAKTHLLSRQE